MMPRHSTSSIWPVLIFKPFQGGLMSCLVIFTIRWSLPFVATLPFSLLQMEQLGYNCWLSLGCVNYWHPGSSYALLFIWSLPLVSAGQLPAYKMLLEHNKSDMSHPPLGLSSCIWSPSPSHHLFWSPQSHHFSFSSLDNNKGFDSLTKSDNGLPFTVTSSTHNIFNKNIA